MSDSTSEINPDEVVETFSAASDENKLTAMRHEQVVHLPGEGEVWMTGDIHDHRTNFNKLIAAADLENHPQRHIVLHELIHGDHFDADGAEDSWRMLYAAAAMKVEFPGQVHFLLANHDLAQIHGEGIMKSGLSVCEAFYSTGLEPRSAQELSHGQRRDHGFSAVTAAGESDGERAVLLPQHLQ